LVDFDQVAACHPSSWLLQDQPLEWRLAMAAIGERLERAGVTEIVFVHGTMTGHDPLGFGSVVRRALPSLHQRIERVIKRVTKAGSDKLLGDLGNYSPAYVRLFESALGHKVRCSSFVWSSGNHHVARVRGAVWLARQLAENQNINHSAKPRVLLIGHSHAGQIFALLTQLLGAGVPRELLLEAARGCGEDEVELRAALERIQRHEFDIVTLGTAPRYAWAEVRGYRVAHLVNHYAGDSAERSLRNLLGSAQGDYVRRLGAAGSDFPAWTDSERRINVRLDEALGKGSDLKTWFSELRAGHALMPFGTTLLVRYGEVSSLKARQFMDTYFGHGVYTRKGAMLFTAKIVADHFYPTLVEVAPPATPRRSYLERLKQKLLRQSRGN
jgi:hypothetical protein